MLAACGRIDFDPAQVPGSEPDALGAPFCPASYTQTTLGGCYRLVESEQTWATAEAKCEADRGHLAIVSSEAERADIDAFVPAGATDVFIGASDRRVEGNYLAIDGTAAWLDWEPGQPEGSNADCLAILASGKLADKDCENAEDYLCEVDGSAIDRTAF